MITFKSKAGRSVDYHTNVGLQLLKMMGRDSKLPSAMFAGDVADARARLQQELQKQADEEAARDEPPANETANEDDDKPAAVSLQTRAEPLLKLLQQAQDANVGLMWE
ncbi:DUF1840 family protein [Arsukibacterium indicum]|uniref:DUF1840 domain-containing protein n=1 Tax=Arsukibacterium indicum TaxID=2848612 RepID=A0ABS6MQH4_9GAMM|nr:DUF1840 family protein [Arsukibacterium indicum]MBV2131073.1 DUF1840 domain-containing protein [Arsukibacterium indicum]